VVFICAQCRKEISKRSCTTENMEEIGMPEFGTGEADLFSGTRNERRCFGRYLHAGIEMLEFIDTVQMKRKTQRALINAFFIICY
jgi:hypothetical protein